MGICIYLSIYPFILIYIYLSFYISIVLSVYLSFINLSTYLYIYLFNLSIFLSILYWFQSYFAWCGNRHFSKTNRKKVKVVIYLRFKDIFVVINGNKKWNSPCHQNNFYWLPPGHTVEHGGQCSPLEISQH